MASKQYSNYQKQVIERYYQNFDDIMLDKLGELVTELYLAESDAKRRQLWQRAERAMKNLKVPQAIIKHIIESGSPDILAKNLNDWLKGKRKM